VNDPVTKDYESITKELATLEASLLKTRELCDGIIKMAYSVLSFDKPYKLVELMENPLISMCVIRYYYSYSTIIIIITIIIYKLDKGLFN
jgi:hypothetical protein